MTSRLLDRIERLERAQRPANANVGPCPPELTRVYLQSIAVGLGGFPQPPGPPPEQKPDDINDGFARGLGYASRDEMESSARSDPRKWERRIEDAERALAERYVKDPAAKGIGRSPGFQIIVGALDEISGKKSSNVAPGETHLWPREKPKFDHTAAIIRLALSRFGIVSEELVKEACGCS